MQRTFILLVVLIQSAFLFAADSSLSNTPLAVNPVNHSSLLCAARYREQLGLLKNNMHAHIVDGTVLREIEHVHAVLDNHQKTDLDEIARRYQILMSELARKRSAFLIKTSHYGGTSAVTDEKIVLQVLGDAFGKNSSLEGHSSQGMLRHRIAKLKQLRDALKAHSFIRDRAMARPCEDIAGVATCLSLEFSEQYWFDIDADSSLKSVESLQRAGSLYLHSLLVSIARQRLPENALDDTVHDVTFIARCC